MLRSKGLVITLMLAAVVSTLISQQLISTLQVYHTRGSSMSCYRSGPDCPRLTMYRSNPATAYCDYRRKQGTFRGSSNPLPQPVSMPQTTTCRSNWRYHGRWPWKLL